MFLLVPAHPGFPGQIPQSRKTVVLCVCVLLRVSQLDASGDLASQDVRLMTQKFLHVCRCSPSNITSK